MSETLKPTINLVLRQRVFVGASLAIFVAVLAVLALSGGSSTHPPISLGAPAPASNPDESGEPATAELSAIPHEQLAEQVELESATGRLPIAVDGEQIGYVDRSDYDSPSEAKGLGTDRGIPVYDNASDELIGYWYSGVGLSLIHI